MRKAVPKQCSMEEKNCVGSVWCVLWEELCGKPCVCCGRSWKKEGGPGGAGRKKGEAEGVGRKKGQMLARSVLRR